MSGLDLSAAVEAGVVADTAWFLHANGLVPDDLGGDADDAAAQRDAVLAVITAAAPIIEAAVREQIAAEIEAAVESQRRNTQSTSALWPGMAFAASLARIARAAR